MTHSRAQCLVCGQGKSTNKCRGCFKGFCSIHLTEHHQELNEQMDEMENNRTLFMNELMQQKQNRQEHFLMKQIDLWENDSIVKIKQTAEECRQNFIKHSKKYFTRLENKLFHLTEQSKQIRTKTTSNENCLSHLQQKLTELTEELKQPTAIVIEESSTLFIDKINVMDRSNRQWSECRISIAGGNELASPSGIFLDDDKTIYIADTGNDRIVCYQSSENDGKVVAGGNGKGKRMNQLNCPTDVIFHRESNSLVISDHANKRVMQWPHQNNGDGQILISYIHCYGLAMDKDGLIYVSDCEKHEVRRWKIGYREGKLVAGGNGRGHGLNQLNHPSFIFVDEDFALYISDCANHRVMKWLRGAKEGIIVAGGNGEGNSFKQLSGPSGVIVDQFNQIYVADRGNNRVMRWFEGATKGSVVSGGNGCGIEANQLFFPMGLSFDREGNLYVADSGSNRIQKFEIDSH